MSENIHYFLYFAHLLYKGMLNAVSWIQEMLDAVSWIQELLNAVSWILNSDPDLEGTLCNSVSGPYIFVKSKNIKTLNVNLEDEKNSCKPEF